MKSVLIPMLMLFSQLSLAGEAFVSIYQCKLVPMADGRPVNLAESRLEVEVSSNDYMGITQAAVTQGTMGLPETDITHRYYLRHEMGNENVLFVGTGLRSQNFELSIFPKRVSSDGGMVAILELDSEKNLELSCRYSGGEINLDE